MTITPVTSLELNQDVARAKRAAESGPVFITEQGKPMHVLLSVEDYRRLTGQDQSRNCSPGIGSSIKNP